MKTSLDQILVRRIAPGLYAVYYKGRVKVVPESKIDKVGGKI